MIRYAHTNLIAKDSKTLIAFYKEALGCKSIGEARDLRGDWLDDMTGISNAHIVGEHLLLPGYEELHPTLEIFSYDEVLYDGVHPINQCGLAHLAFEVDDVEESLQKILSLGGKTLGEVVRAEYGDGRSAVFVYATDPEGNIVELQNWRHK